MKAMRKRFLATGLGLLAVAMVANDASATRFTETANFVLSRVDFPTLIPPPLTAQELSGDVDGGGLFTNTYAPVSASSAVVRTVGINRIVTYSVGSEVVVSPVGAGNIEAYVIFALDGVATATSPTEAAALFTSGRAIVVSINDSTPLFDPENPSTWQAALLPGNIIAAYDLAPQEAVVQGANGDTIGLFPAGVSANETNFSAINTVSDSLTQGVFIFDFDANGAAIPVNPDFQVNQNPLSGLPGTEGLVIISQQTNPNPALNFDGSASLVGVVQDATYDANEATLNSIYSFLLPGLTFSDNTIPGVSQFDLGNGVDFYNEFGFSANPTSQAAIPEPATLALGVMGLAGLMLRRRRLA